MPPRKRPATAQTGRGNKRVRTAEQAEESHARGIRTRRQLIDNPDAESGSEDSEEAGAEEEEDGHDSSEELLSSLSSEQVDMCVSQARMQIKRALIAPRVLGDQGQNVIEDLFSALLRGESNSALLLGPHGTGKTSVCYDAEWRIATDMHVVNCSCCGPKERCTSPLALTLHASSE